MWSVAAGSLPDRQLRKQNDFNLISISCSLPDRQLRNLPYLRALNGFCSLPDRQLRNVRKILKDE